MVMLATLARTKERLRIDTDDGDGDLTSLIEGASAMVLNYLKIDSDTYTESTGETYVDSNGDMPDVPIEVQTAVMYLVGILSRDRDGKEMKDWQQGYLPMPVIAMLTMLRDPTLR